MPHPDEIPRAGGVFRPEQLLKSDPTGLDVMLNEAFGKPPKPKVHIGYDHESMNINIEMPGSMTFFERGLLEDCDYIEALTKAFERLGCEVTSTLEY